MISKELNSFRLSDAVKFHDTLNPKLWNNNKLRPEVKRQLKIIADDFLEELGVKALDVIDITVSGSNAAYSYTDHSDLDLHILVDFSKLPNNEVYAELFNAKKTLYNDSHDIKVHGVPVELYIQDSNEPVISLGEYSMLNDKWIKIPSKRRANFDQNISKLKYNKLLDIIKIAIKSNNLNKIQKSIKKIKQYRQAGLDKGGEFSPENLAYKALRSQGYITKLYNLRDKLHSENLSIESMYAENKVLDKPTLSIHQLVKKHNVTYEEILDQLVKGVNIELEHTSDEVTAREIALDHLAEDPKYYDKLAKLNLEEDPTMQFASEKTPAVNPYGGLEDTQFRGSIGESASPQFVYHVTPTKNLKAIAKQGLTPNLGDRSSQIAGEKSGIYVFPDRVSAEDAVMNWLGDEFEDEPLTMLKIDISGLEKNISKGADYELIVDTVIEPKRIKKVNVQL